VRDDALPPGEYDDMADRPSISSTAAEVSREVIDFVQTRVGLLRSELKENVAGWKIAAAMGGIALVFLITSCLSLAVTITCLIAVFLPTLFRGVIASIATTVISSGCVNLPSHQRRVSMHGGTIKIGWKVEGRRYERADV
jgi:uncharacterized membrane protein YqjE